MQKKNRIVKVLIANRGEIAVRIQKACDSLRIPSTCVASEPDKTAFFARNAHELSIIGPASAKESYLNIDKLLLTASKHGCNAIHPGYGFLSESHEFAKRVEDEGLIFIGPRSEVIRNLGSKTEARKRAISLGVPCSLGIAGGLNDEELIKGVKKVGFPIIIKAVAGGGGRGMRIVKSEAELQGSITTARNEALKGFGSADIYFEKFIESPRHVEVQIFGDNYGHIVHFGTRDCSTQRRNQKLIEEAPAPFLDNKLREKIHAAAVSIGKGFNYSNAGTVEFLVKDKEFYFLEVNTRIQVEHPVTEEITDTDLVALQIRIANGEKLPFKQKDIKFNGHAIEFRMCAEDSSSGFLPTSGLIEKYEFLKEQPARHECGFSEGDSISTHYDGMFAKIIVKGATRNEAIVRSEKILKNLSLQGLKTNLDFHRWMLRHSSFQNRPVDIHFVQREFNQKCLEDLANGDFIDPEWKEPIDGACFVEYLNIRSNNLKKRIMIEIWHEEDQIFSARLVVNGKTSQKKHWIRSNGKKAAVEAVIANIPVL